MCTAATMWIDAVVILFYVHGPSALLLLLLLLSASPPSDILSSNVSERSAGSSGGVFAMRRKKNKQNKTDLMGLGVGNRHVNTEKKVTERKVGPFDRVWWAELSCSLRQNRTATKGKQNGDGGLAISKQ